MQNLKQELPLQLDTEIKQHISSGENILISIPGGFGEALVTTDKRVMVIREKQNSLETGCNVFSYPLTNIAEATITPSNTGGYIEIALQQDTPNPDECRVYFPSYKMSDFKAAANALNTIASPIEPQDTPSIAAPSDSTQTKNRCPKCNGQIREGDAYCSRCGEQVSIFCANCNLVMAPGSAFCSYCGQKAEEYKPECPTCGARVMRSHTYCTECGSILTISCIVCGAKVEPHYKHCASCGRVIGSDRLDPAAARAAQQRLTNLHEMQTGRAEKEPEYEQESVDVSDSAQNTAEYHNQQGQKYFEESDLSQAIKEFKIAVSMAPDNSSYHCNLAIAYDENEQDEKALAEYEKTLELDPNDLTAMLYIGYMFNENDDEDTAKEYWNKVIQIAPMSAEAQEAKENIRHLQDL